MTANDDLLDRGVDHSIDLLGYGNNVNRRVMALINRAGPDIVAQIIALRDNLPASQFSVDRLEQLLGSIRQINEGIWREVTALLDSELAAFTDFETGWQQRSLEAVQPLTVVAVDAGQVYAAAMSRPFQGRLLREWLSELEADTAIKFRDQIRIGYIEGETTDQIVRRIRGTRALNYSDGIMEITRRNAQTVVLTAVSHTADYARQAVYDANKDIVKGYRYTATLDLRTTAVCRARDGNFYPMGTKRPALPAHMRCRSVYTPVVKSFREMGLNADDLTPGTRASLDGQVPRELTYQGWLSRQSVARQEEVLGVTKAKLFRDGKLTLDRFVARDGHEYTLDELRRREAAAFERAGL